MNELQIFMNERFGTIRSILIDGEPYFVGKDKIEEINTRFEKFVNDESIGFYDYLYGNYHVQFFRDENQKPYIQVTFP